MNLWPGNFASLGEVGDGRLVFIKADADDFEAGVVISAIGGLQARQLGNTRSAPGSPEIDQDVFTAIIGESNRAAR